eukprot:gene13024-13153_t
MGRPIEDDTTGAGLLAKTKIDMSHQEMSRLLQHLEELWAGYTQELGYEDEPEFEDALQGSFSDFLNCLPHAIKKTENGREYFQLKVDPPRSEWKPVKMTVKINEVSDLWRVCLKSPYARVEIPELEFEISADGKRHVDSIYNHIGSAVYNLGNYVQQANTGLSDDHKDKIMDTVIALNIFLDVPKPWTWIVHDPSGLSEFKPMEGVLLRMSTADLVIITTSAAM